MNKICTSIEQSRKLIELGIDIKTSDMYYWCGEELRIYVGGYKAQNKEYDIPAWSLSALMSLLPSIFTVKGEYSETTCYKIDIRTYALTKDVDIYQIAYGNYHWYEDGGHSWSDMINSGEKEELIDAAFQMVVWLKENEKI